MVIIHNYISVSRTHGPQKLYVKLAISPKLKDTD